MNLEKLGVEICAQQPRRFSSQVTQHVDGERKVRGVDDGDPLGAGREACSFRIVESCCPRHISDPSLGGVFDEGPSGGWGCEIDDDIGAGQCVRGLVAEHDARLDLFA